MLMGRVLRSTIPCTSAVLQQSTPQHMHKRLVDFQSWMWHQYNHNAKALPELAPGSTVHIQTRRGWAPAVVRHQGDEPRLYTVQIPAGKTFRRNRWHLRKIHQSLCKDVDPDELLDEMSTQTPRPADQSPGNSPVRVDEHPTHHTRRAVITITVAANNSTA